MAQVELPEEFLPRAIEEVKKVIILKGIGYIYIYILYIQWRIQGRADGAAASPLKDVLSLNLAKPKICLRS